MSEDESGMSDRVRLVAIVGSLRAASLNRCVFRTATELVGTAVELVEAPIGDVPLYNGDLEADGDPDPVQLLRGAVAGADGLLIFTPEYNRSIPAVTKNAVDWLSRMPGSSVLSQSIIGVIAASPGGHDAAGVRAHLADSLAPYSKALFQPSFGIARVSQKLSDGRIVDDETRSRLKKWLADFVNFQRQNAGPDGPA